MNSNIANARCVEKVFRHVFMVSNGRKITVQERATTPIKNSVTEGDFTNNDGRQMQINQRRRLATLLGTGWAIWQIAQQGNCQGTFFKVSRLLPMEHLCY